MRKAASAFLVLVTLLGCGRLPSGTGRPPTPVTVSYTTQPQCTLVHVAVANGYFAGEGLEVRSTVHTHGKAALQSLLEHKADFATVAETPVMFNALKGEKFLVIANIEASSLNNAIVARKDAGILAPADLKGKRIAFTPGTTSDFFLDSLLSTVGLTRKEVRPVPLKPEEMMAAILPGQIDAACTWNYPLTQIKRRLGANGTTLVDREIYTETFNIAASPEIVGQNPGVVHAFLKALIRAERFVAEHPAEAQAIMAKATGTEAWIVQEVWDAFNYRVQLNQTLLITLEDETRWAIRHKLGDRTTMPDYRTYIHVESLRQVQPEAVKADW